MMNRQMRRLSEKNGRSMQKKSWNLFKDITSEAHERHAILNPDSTYEPRRVWQNNQYIVQLHGFKMFSGKKWDRVMVRRSDSAPIYSWSDLFKIKNEIFGEEIEAINFFPRVSELTDDANLYWFYIKSDDLNEVLK